MRVIIEYHYIKSNHLLASPEFDHEEIIEVDTQIKLKKYIESQKDQYDNNFIKNKKHGFDYISRQGGVKVKKYVSPIIKKI